MKVNADMIKFMLLGGKKGLVCDSSVDVRKGDHVSGFKYVGYVMDRLKINGTGSGRKGKLRMQSGHM